jgi:hypothetical protein
VTDPAKRLSDSDLELVAQAQPEVLGSLDGEALKSLLDRLRRSRDIHRDAQRRDAQRRMDESKSRAVAADETSGDVERTDTIESALAAVESEVARRESAASAEVREQRLEVARGKGGGGGANPGSGKAQGPGAAPGKKPTARDRNQSAVTRASQKRNQAKRDGR